MKARFSGLLSRSVAGALFTTLVFTSVASAQSTQGQAAFAQGSLLQQAQALLATNPNGGEALATAIKNLALSDAANMPAIIATLLASANVAQQAAVGQGLGLAAAQLAQSNDPQQQQQAANIAAAVAASDSSSAKTSFAAASGNTQTAAGGPGGAGGGGGGGGPTGPNSGPPSGGGGGGGGSGSGGGSPGNSPNNPPGLTGGGTVGGGGSGGGSVSPR